MLTHTASWLLLTAFSFSASCLHYPVDSIAISQNKIPKRQALTGSSRHSPGQNMPLGRVLVCWWSNLSGPRCWGLGTQHSDIIKRHSHIIGDSYIGGCGRKVKRRNKPMHTFHIQKCTVPIRKTYGYWHRHMCVCAHTRTHTHTQLNSWINEVIPFLLLIKWSYIVKMSILFQLISKSGAIKILIPMSLFFF